LGAAAGPDGPSFSEDAVRRQHAAATGTVANLLDHCEHDGSPFCGPEARQGAKFCLVRQPTNQPSTRRRPPTNPGTPPRCAASGNNVQRRAFVLIHEVLGGPPQACDPVPRRAFPRRSMIYVEVNVPKATQEMHVTGAPAPQVLPGYPPVAEPRKPRSSFPPTAGETGSAVSYVIRTRRLDPDLGERSRERATFQSFSSSRGGDGRLHLHTQGVANLNKNWKSMPAAPQRETPGIAFFNLALHSQRNPFTDAAQGKPVRKDGLILCRIFWFSRSARKSCPSRVPVGQGSAWPTTGRPTIDRPVQTPAWSHAALVISTLRGLPASAGPVLRGAALSSLRALPTVQGRRPDRRGWSAAMGCPLAENPGEF